MKFLKISSVFAILFVIFACVGTEQSNTKNMQAKTSFYDLKTTLSDGKVLEFKTLKGKKVLLVNTASKCGFTKQYDALEELYQKYKNKLVIIAFPSNQFGGQEPGTNEEIAAFCKKNYGVTFLIAQKSDVKGASQNDVYKWLSDKEKNGWNTEVPSWNFGKYLVDEKGNLISFFPSNVVPMDEKITKNFK
jgi:glutathione peroxidase